MILDGAQRTRDRLLVVGTGIDRIAFVGVDVGGNAGGDAVEIGDFVDGGGEIGTGQPSARRGRFERQGEGLALARREIELVGNEAFTLARRERGERRRESGMHLVEIGRRFFGHSERVFGGLRGWMTDQVGR
jgi:hypothetical protein